MGNLLAIFWTEITTIPQLTFCIILPYALRHTSYLTLPLTQNGGGGGNSTLDVRRLSDIKGRTRSVN